MDRFDLADGTLEAARAVLAATHLLQLWSSTGYPQQLEPSGSGWLPPPPPRARTSCRHHADRCIIERAAGVVNTTTRRSRAGGLRESGRQQFVGGPRDGETATRAESSRVAGNVHALPTIAELASYLDTLPRPISSRRESGGSRLQETLVDGARRRLLQAMVVVGSLLLDQAPSIVTHAAIYVTWRQFNACVAAQVGVLVSLVCSCVLVLVAVLANRCLAPVSHGDIVRIPLFSLMYMRWLAAQHATRAAAQAVSSYSRARRCSRRSRRGGAAVGDDVVLDAGYCGRPPVRNSRHQGPLPPPREGPARTSSSEGESCWRPSSWSGAPSWAYGPASAPAAWSKRTTPSTRSRTSRAARRAPTATSLF